MYEFNKYENFYITTTDVLQSLISELLSERQNSARGYGEDYLTGYLAALYRVQAAVKRQAYVFDIR